ncbi:hypothetical protein TcBrA4_0064520 [Trypanosoma cruzi]|nr:hypothetical protein TcBrA4_0064520 [Trypanosoma cruzi]
MSRVLSDYLVWSGVLRKSSRQRTHGVLTHSFHSHPARPSSQPAPLLPSIQTCGETVDPDIWSLPEVSQEELQRWREEKLSLSDRLLWRGRKPIKQVNMQRM